MSLKISLEYYNAFYYVAQLGSISKAAESLHLTQPAVSHTINQLEDNLGCKLFYRQSRGITLTESGKTLLPYVESMLSNIQAGEKRIRKITTLESGDLYIGAVETAYINLLPRCIARFKKAYPNINLHFVGPSTNQIIEGINNGTLDLGLVISPLAEYSDNFNLFPLFETRDVIVVGDHYPELLDHPVQLSELLSYPFICLKKGTAGRSYIESYFQQNQCSFRPSYSLSSPHNIVELTKYNLGLGVVVEDFVRRDIFRGELSEVNIVPKLPERQIFLIVSKKFELSAACREFVQFIKLEA